MVRYSFSICDLSVRFKGMDFNVVDRFTLSVAESESVALIGESGSGKSVSVMAALGLLDDIADVSGDAVLLGKRISDMSDAEVRDSRGRDVGYIPQSPGTAMNPVRTIGSQMSEFLFKVKGIPCANGKEMCKDLLERFGLSRDTYGMYPHQLSGGMQERALVATYLLVEPKVLIADEPTKGLDDETKERIISLLLQDSKERSTIVITHDTDVARRCDKVGVMYLGNLVEYGESGHVLEQPMHPYTAGLVASHPKNGMRPIPRGLREHSEGGCIFYARCRMATDGCKTSPEMRTVSERQVRCLNVGN